ncbi:MAG: zinc ABC transporter substrate-binding protein ZnuA [Oceanospirillales bacterium]|nr:zinc ABC transporter substrate-binding protein ZnuA [Oceanospirillales bacterium]
MNVNGDGCMGWISRMARGSALLALFLVATASAQAEAQEPASDGDVVVSIRPLALITAALMEGIGEPRILLADGASPHHYALKPSDMRSLTDARLVVWVGPDLERFLDKPLSRTQAHTLALTQSHDATDKADLHEHEDTHDDHGDTHDEHEHDHHGVDVHPWLDPGKALEMSHEIAAELEKIYPQHADLIASNLRAFESSLAAVDERIDEMLKPVSTRGFYVFHDAYSGFVGHYGLNQLGYFTLNPSQKPGARHLAEIREQLEAQHAVCVLSEPQFSSAVVDSITSGLPLNHAELDPLAMGVSPTADAYPLYLLELAQRIESCLAE